MSSLPPLPLYRTLSQKVIARTRYPNVPWLMAPSATYLDEAQYKYGRKESWGAHINKNQQQQHDEDGMAPHAEEHDNSMGNKKMALQPITLLLQYCRDMSREVVHQHRRADRLARRLRRRRAVHEAWVKESVEKGPHVLAQWQHVDQLPGAAPPLIKENSAAADGAIGGSGASRKLDGALIEDAEAGNLRYDPDLARDLRHEAPEGPSRYPFLRMRAEDQPQTLHPALARWTKSWYPESVDRESVELPVTGKSEVKPSEAAKASTAKADSSSSQKQRHKRSGRRRRMATSLRVLHKSLPSHDAEGAYRDTRKRSRHAQTKLVDPDRVVKVDWATEKLAARQGYAGQRAKERRTRIVRGEDIY
eukprot:PhM_4_TR17056/c2_g1_i1/m.90385